MDAYSVGDWVTWSTSVHEDGYTFADLLALGDGPFQVQAVRNAPQNRCNCGMPRSWPHLKGCTAIQPNGVGHPQWVTVEGRRISGALVCPVEAPASTQ